jgi:hypothetical protein
MNSRPQRLDAPAKLRHEHERHLTSRDRGLDARREPRRPLPRQAPVPTLEGYSDRVARSRKPRRGAHRKTRTRNALIAAATGSEQHADSSRYEQRHPT